MIRVTLELVPGGVGEPERLGEIEIHNLVGTTLSSSGKRGDYGYEIEKKRRDHVTHSGTILDFPRRSYHPWNLVKRVLDQAAESGVI